MSIPNWQPGTTYLPGAVVTPKSNPNLVVQVQPYNNTFDDGLTQWTITPSGPASACSASTEVVFDGTQSAYFAGYAGDGTLNSSTAQFINQYMAPVKPGRSISFSCWIQYIVGNNPNGAFANGSCGIAWYDSSSNFISFSEATSPSSPGAPRGGTPGYTSQVGSIWEQSSGTAVAPAGAAYAAAVIWLNNNTSGSSVYADDYQWDYTEQGYPSGLVYIAVQAGAGVSGQTEPTWPLTSGDEVTDNTVTWEAEYASIVVWEAQSILTSGATEPTWPTTVGGSVVDNDIIWTATDGLITDPNCPQSAVVQISNAKIYAANNDIINFCATTNPLDWSSSNNAGFIPFGLQPYGNEPCEVLASYRSNLVAMNTLGYQMWQTDPDPANIAILDAEPVGSEWNKAAQPDNNDLVFLSPVGIRNLSTVGPSGNLQAGTFGKQVDPIVMALINQLEESGYEPRGLYFPGTGQYWCLIGSEALVMTINGASSESWSRYTFPDVITDWTVANGVLYLRSQGGLVWEMSDETLVDDDQGSAGNTPFRGYMAWNYCEFGAIGVDKFLQGFDLTIGNIDDSGLVQLANDLECTVTVGYNQANPELATEPFTITGDTIPGTMVPLPLIAPSMQFRLDFGTGQNWGWGALNVYSTALPKPGSVGG